MIDLEARQKYVHFTIARRIVLFITALPASIFFIVMMFMSIINGGENIKVPLNISLIFGTVALLVGVFFILFDGFLKKRLRKLAARQFFIIVNTTKINNNPKVVYIYTCHNDMIESRLLQNIQQTYKNIEVWVSDGSTDEVLSKKYKQFAIDHKLNYFKVEGGSKNKAHNLNTFLEKVNPIYDYLLISDTDEVLHKDFVDNALKCFNSGCFNNLGFVSPLNYCYDTQTLFSNVGLNLENSMFFKQNYTRTITLGDIPNLVSFSCLVSKKVMEVNNNRFPDSNLEDFYLEYISLSNGFVGLCLPTAPCGQTFDKTTWHYFRRVMRIYDWSIKLVKDGAYNVYNEKYSGWYLRLFNYAILLAPFIFILIIFVPLLFWFITVYYQALFTNINFIMLLVSAVLLGIATIITVVSDTGSKKTGNKYSPVAGIFSFFYGMAFIPLLIKHWFNALFRSKYSGFEASRGTKTKNTNLVPCWIVAIISLVCLAIFITCYALFIKFALNWMLLLFFYVTIILIIVFLCAISFVVLDAFGKKIVNKDYDESKFIYPREFYQFNKERQEALEIINRKEAKND